MKEKPDLHIMFLFLSFFALCQVACMSPPKAEILHYNPVVFHAQKQWLDLVKKKVLSLNDCVQIGLQRNLLLKVATIETQLAEEKAEEYFDQAILPHIRSQGIYSFRNNTPGVVTGGFTVKTGKKEKFLSSISLEIPIWGFGKFWNQYKAIQKQGKAAKGDEIRQKDTLTLAIVRLYFQILFLKSQKKTLEKAIAILKAQLNQVENLYQQGLLTHDEVGKVKIPLLSRQQKRQELIHQEEILKNQLKNLLALPLSYHLEIQEMPQIPSRPFQLSPLLSLLTERSDFKAMRLRIRALQDEYKALWSRFFPTLAFKGEYFYSSDSSLLHQDWLSLTLGADWTLFDGGSRFSLLRQKKLEIEKLSLFYRQKVDEAFQEVKKYFLLCKDYQSALNVAKEQIALSRETLARIQEKYARGLVTIVDVLREEGNLTESRLTYNQALYQLYQGLYQLYYFLGKPLQKVSTLILSKTDSIQKGKKKVDPKNPPKIEESFKKPKGKNGK